jgi:RHS repeat-associated protein
MEQADANTPTVQVEEYDPVNQLLSSTVHSGTIAGSIVKQFIYQYDVAGNRTSEQIQSGAGASPAVGSASYNNLNQLTSRTGSGGQIRFRGSLNETGTVTVAGSPATMKAHTNFTGYASVSQGTNSISVVASDYSGHSRTNNFQVVVTNNGVAKTISYDLNGNETSVVTATSTNTYQWDAANRMVSATGPTNQSLFTYDGVGRRVQIIEKTNGVAISTNKFVWDGVELCEQRNNTGGTVTKRFFGQGEQISGTNYFFTFDHLGSIREMTDNSGTIQARYDYDPYGKRTKVLGSLDADFGFSGYFYHSVSGLCLTLFRAYDSDLGRWLNRDPIGEEGGLNLYGYVGNDPLNWIDPLGLDWLDAAANFSAGFGDSLTFGLTDYIRDQWGISDAVDHCSGFYKGGKYAEIGAELALTGGSAAMKQAAKQASRQVVRAEARAATRNIARAGNQLHHNNPLFGHPGGGSTLFPTGGLPASIHSGSANLQLLDRASHLEAHRSLQRLEMGAAALVNPATTAGRAARNSNNFGCK